MGLNKKNRWIEIEKNDFTYTSLPNILIHIQIIFSNIIEISFKLFLLKLEHFQNGFFKTT